MPVFSLQVYRSMLSMLEHPLNVCSNVVTLLTSNDVRLMPVSAVQPFRMAFMLVRLNVL